MPNLVNQILSFVLKKNKSGRVVRRALEHLPRQEGWGEARFYLYMKRIKEAKTHYLDEGAVQRLVEIQEPSCEIYPLEEQEFYMQVCRIAVLFFLDNDAILISLTSSRMSRPKREMHLIARDALIRKIRQLARDFKF